jgi:hypothetical protein
MKAPNQTMQPTGFVYASTEHPSALRRTDFAWHQTVRSRPTAIRERVYIYASLKPGSAKEFEQMRIRIRKSKRQPKLPGRQQETVRFFNAVKKGSASGRTTMTLLRERERSDDNDVRAFLLSNTAEERIESLKRFTGSRQNRF